MELNIEKREKFIENRGERKKKSRKVIKNSVPVLPEAQTLDTHTFEYGIYINSRLFHKNSVPDDYPI
jgi:hypothetical protein